MKPMLETVADSMATPHMTEARIRRAVKGAIDGGVLVGAVEVLPDGTIRILPMPQTPLLPDKRKPEPW
jgi:hypothetical protein